MMLFHLPTDIFRLIQSYSSTSDYHYFLNSSKEHFSRLKKESLYLVLTIASSKEYIANPIYREIVLSRVANGWKQISLRTREDDEEMEENPIAADIPVHRIKVDFLDLADYSHIECVESVTCHKTSVPPIPAIKELRLGRCGSLIDVSNLSHLSKLELVVIPLLTDITPLRDIPHLTFSGCHSVKDFSVLSGLKQKSLEIDDSVLTDVSSFRGIRYLTLNFCDQLEDVSPLKAVHSLTLFGCKRVKDISGLGDHHSLRISLCSYELVGYDSLLYIPHVQLNGCNISNLNVLKHAKTVSLVNCTEIIDVTPLNGLKSLTIQGCPNIGNIDSLRNIPDLSLVYKSEIPDLRKLTNKRLHLQYITQDAFPHPIEADYFSFLKNIQELSLFQCDNIVELIDEGRVEYFQHLQSLSISSSMILKHVNGLGTIPRLYIYRCYNLRDISALGRNQYVRLHNCISIEDVSALATVPIVDIRYCWRLRDYSCLSKVQRLTVYD